MDIDSFMRHCLGYVAYTYKLPKGSGIPHAILMKTNRLRSSLKFCQFAERYIVKSSSQPLNNSKTAENLFTTVYLLHSTQGGTVGEFQNGI
jgi:hypothetical protein